MQLSEEAQDVFFISHMVQMKDAPLFGYQVLEVILYIPHGSDERRSAYACKAHNQSFISHMVQMKVDIEMPQVFFHPRLYIPHGSDES